MKRLMPLGFNSLPFLKRMCNNLLSQLKKVKLMVSKIYIYFLLSYGEQGTLGESEQ